MKNCIACGMPIKVKLDYAMGDETKDYCKYCAKPDGSMQSYEEKLKSMTHFIKTTKGLEEDTARKIAEEMMAKLPAWK